MKKAILLIVVLFTVFGYSQEIDVKDTVKWWVKDGDTLISSYSNNQANAIEKLLNHKLLYPNSNPQIFPEGFVTVIAKDLNAESENTNYLSSEITSVLLNNDNITIDIKQKGSIKPEYYMLVVNDSIIGEKLYPNQLKEITIMDSEAPDIYLIPIYPSLNSNKINQ